MSYGDLPPLECIQCFIAAATSASFREAARQLHITPAALGQRIRQLEEVLDTVLFERTTRSRHLTKSGLALLPAARNAVESVRVFASTTDAEFPQEAVLGTRWELGLSWLLPAVSVLERDLKGLRVHLYFGSSDELLRVVGSGQVDAIVSSVRHSDPKLTSIPLHAEHYALVSTPNVLHENPIRRVAALEHHELVDIGPDLPLFRYWMDGAALAEIPSFRQVRYLGTGAAIHAYVNSGNGVAVLPRQMVARALERGRLVEVLPSIRAASDMFRLLYRSANPRVSLMERIASALQKVALR